MKKEALEVILKTKNKIIEEAAKFYLFSYATGKDIMFKSKGIPEDEVFKGLLEDVKAIGMKENVPEEWTQELIEAFKRKVEEYRSMDEKHSTEMIKLLYEELKSKKEKLPEEGTDQLFKDFIKHDVEE